MLCQAGKTRQCWWACASRARSCCRPVLCSCSRSTGRLLSYFQAALLLPPYHALGRIHRLRQHREAGEALGISARACQLNSLLLTSTPTPSSMHRPSQRASKGRRCPAMPSHAHALPLSRCRTRRSRRLQVSSAARAGEFLASRSTSNSDPAGGGVCSVNCSWLLPVAGSNEMTQRLQP